ncbi:MAG TPA: YrhA family protein [Pyrinomonadaceae bacterium]|nr:YrhA family protein [Pyrinomonadaceae bacterium]
MYEQLLTQVGAEQAKYGEQAQPPCTEERLERLRQRARRELGVEVPEEYAAFLRAQDGLNHNGLFIYASETSPVAGAPDATIEGLVEANLGWRDDEHFNSYLVFGEGNMDLYVRHLPTGDYQVIDRTPGNLIETHPSLDQLIAAALKAHL